MINHEMRFISGPSGISVSTETSFESDDDAFVFMAVVNRHIANTTANKVSNMITQVLNHVNARGANQTSAIELIKSYRNIANTGLKEAKDWVEANMEDYIDRRPYNQY